MAREADSHHRVPTSAIAEPYKGLAKYSFQTSSTTDLRAEAFGARPLRIIMLGPLSRFCAQALVGLTAASTAMGLNILLTNDDSWASANIRYVVRYCGLG